MKYLLPLIALINVAAFEYRPSPDIFGIDRAVYCAEPQSFADEHGSVNDASVSFVKLFGSRPYGLKDLNCSEFSGGYAGENFSPFVRVSYFGSGFYSESRIRYGMNIRTGFVGIGFSGDLMRHAMDMEGTKYAKFYSDFNAGLIIQPAGFIRAGVFQSGIFALVKKDREVYSPAFSAGAALRPFCGAEFSANIVLRDKEKIRLFELSVNISRNLNCSFGYSPDLSVYSVSGSLYLAHTKIQYVFRNHTVLGITHNVSVSYVFGDSGVESVGGGFYSAKTFEKIRDIDIQTADMDELLSIEGITSDIARRIISYRERFGKITRRALIQLGVDGDLLKSVEERVNNLAEPNLPTSVNKKDRVRYVYKTKKNKTDLFNKLVLSGVPHSAALRIADDFMIKGREYVLKGIERYSLEKNIISKAADICAEY